MLILKKIVFLFSAAKVSDYFMLIVIYSIDCMLFSYKYQQFRIVICRFLLSLQYKIEQKGYFYESTTKVHTLRIEGDA